uniref:torsin-1A-like n=1 Tax=Semicossyphus pulcher TaxID=241346 RepID=UPI0037E809AA
MMRAVRLYLLLHIFLTVFVQVNTFDPTTATLVSVFGHLWQRVYNSQDSCDSKWISFNATGLKADLETKLFGQHIASGVILEAVTGFMTNDYLQKPLVLSLHGPSGTGKNFVSQLIAENIYKEGMDSDSVHVFTSLLHFPHEHLIETYKSQLQQWIKGNVSNCARSMFIFDDMEKMHPGLIDSIKPFLDYYNKLDGVSYRKTIFIFISNNGRDFITQKALDFWKEGRGREEIKLRDLETSLSDSAFNSENGFWHSTLIDENLIDYFIPFLPLEHRHVVQCVMAEMKARRLQPDLKVAEKVAKGLRYIPQSERAFSKVGCKTVGARLYSYKY